MQCINPILEVGSFQNVGSKFDNNSQSIPYLPTFPTKSRRVFISIKSAILRAYRKRMGGRES